MYASALSEAAAHLTANRSSADFIEKGTRDMYGTVPRREHKVGKRLLLLFTELIPHGVQDAKCQSEAKSKDPAEVPHARLP
jgi:hypothetical protein